VRKVATGNLSAKKLRLFNRVAYCRKPAGALCSKASTNGRPRCPEKALPPLAIKARYFNRMTGPLARPARQALLDICHVSACDYFSHVPRTSPYFSHGTRRLPGDRQSRLPECPLLPDPAPQDVDARHHPFPCGNGVWQTRRAAASPGSPWRAAVCLRRSWSESRMPENGTSGLMSGEGERDRHNRETALLLDSTRQPISTTSATAPPSVHSHTDATRARHSSRRPAPGSATPLNVAGCALSQQAHSKTCPPRNPNGPESA